MALSFLSKPKWYDNIWNAYQQHTHKKILEEVAQHIQEINLPQEETLRILDISCGTGTLLQKLEEIGKIDLHGIDTSQEMLSIAKTKTNATLTCGDAQDLHYDNNTFHIIISSSAYHLYKDKQRFITEAERCLKHKGLLIILDWDASGLHKYIYRLMNTFVDETIYSESSQKSKERFRQIRTDDIDIQKWFWWTWKFFLITAQKNDFKK